MESPKILSCPSDVRAALIIGHPGHELRVHGWIELIRPKIFVLTDGSGRSGRSRLASTQKVVCQNKSQCGEVFGRFTDIELYDMLISREHERLVSLAEELAYHLASDGINFIVGDSAEGYNPSHDVCRLLIDSAVSRLDYPVINLAFPLVEPPDAVYSYQSQSIYRCNLDDNAFARKMKSAESYQELASELATAIAHHGYESFREEWFATGDRNVFVNGCAANPWYEQYGAAQVKAGHYQTSIQFREHILPLVHALRQPTQTIA